MSGNEQAEDLGVELLATAAQQLLRRHVLHDHRHALEVATELTRQLARREAHLLIELAARHADRQVEPVRVRLVRERELLVGSFEVLFALQQQPEHDVRIGRRTIGFERPLDLDARVLEAALAEQRHREPASGRRTRWILRQHGAQPLLCFRRATEREQRVRSEIEKVEPVPFALLECHLGELESLFVATSVERRLHASNRGMAAEHGVVVGRDDSWWLEFHSGCPTLPRPAAGASLADAARRLQPEFEAKACPSAAW